MKLSELFPMVLTEYNKPLFFVRIGHRAKSKFRGGFPQEQCQSAAANSQLYLFKKERDFFSG